MSTPNPMSQFLKAFAHIKLKTVAFCKSARNMSWFENSTEHLITCLTLKRSFKIRFISLEVFMFMDKWGGGGGQCMQTPTAVCGLL